MRAKQLHNKSQAEGADSASTANPASGVGNDVQPVRNGNWNALVSRARTCTRRSRVIFLLSALIPSSIEAQHWEAQNPPISPLGRSGHAMAWRAASQDILLFGGQAGLGSQSLQNDTWAWNGTSWTQLMPSTSPSPRAGHAMAYDHARHRMVLFGGQDANGSFLQDTWDFDGANWIPRLLATFPPARARHGMAYDKSRNQMVLFGGGQNGDCNGGSLFFDTWEWNGTSAWVPRPTQTNPSPRHGLNLTYAEDRQIVILFGGQNFCGGYYSDTWTWNGSVWTQATPSAAPAGRSSASVAYDLARGRMVVFGGRRDSFASTMPFNDTTEWDGTTWISPRPINSPSAQQSGAMAYDPVRERLVMFGGHFPYGIYNQPSFLGVTYTWSGHTALLSSYGTGCGAPTLTLSERNGSLPVSGAQLELQVANCNPQATFLAIGLSNTNLGPFTLPFDLYGYGAPGCYVWHDCLFELNRQCYVAGPTNAQIDYPIPPATWLHGVPIYLQAWTLAASQNLAGISTSNGLRAVIGNQ